MLPYANRSAVCVRFPHLSPSHLQLLLSSHCSEYGELNKMLPVVYRAHLLPVLSAPVSLGCYGCIFNCGPFPNSLLLRRYMPRSLHAALCNAAALWSRRAPNSLTTLIELGGPWPPL